MGKSNDKNPKRAPKEQTKKFRKKVCVFCARDVVWIDYKEVDILRKYMSERGKIRARRVSGNCAQHQRDIAVAIKTAREVALLPYTQRTVTERTRGRPSNSPATEALYNEDFEEVGDDEIEIPEGLDIDEAVFAVEEGPEEA